MRVDIRMGMHCAKTIVSPSLPIETNSLLPSQGCSTMVNLGRVSSLPVEGLGTTRCGAFARIVLAASVALWALGLSMPEVDWQNRREAAITSHIKLRFCQAKVARLPL